MRCWPALPRPIFIGLYGNIKLGGQDFTWTRFFHGLKKFGVVAVVWGAVQLALAIVIFNAMVSSNNFIFPS